MKHNAKPSCDLEHALEEGYVAPFLSSPSHLSFSTAGDQLSYATCCLTTDPDNHASYELGPPKLPAKVLCLLVS